MAGYILRSCVRRRNLPSSSVMLWHLMTIYWQLRMSNGYMKWMANYSSFRLFRGHTVWDTCNRLSVPRHIDWELVYPVRGLSVGRLEDLDMPFLSKEVFGLFPRCAQRGYPKDETPRVART